MLIRTNITKEKRKLRHGVVKLFLLIISIIDNNIEINDFNVNHFCEISGLWQPYVNRKIKSITNLLVTEFIRSRRLHKAAQLIADKQYTVQKICYKVGFSNPSYFTKCLKSNTENYRVSVDEFSEFK